MAVAVKTATGTAFSLGYVAQATGLSRSTIRRMIEQGKLDAWQTPGGHQRIADHDVARLVWECTPRHVQEMTTRIIQQEVEAGNPVAIEASKTLGLDA